MKRSHAITNTGIFPSMLPTMISKKCLHNIDSTINTLCAAASAACCYEVKLTAWQ
jgi:hypothetical protein